MQRTAPHFTPRSGPFWTSGKDGKLRIARCQACGWWLHPPRPACPKCQGLEVAFESVSGKGTVWAWTINRYQWAPGMKPPYIIAQIELAEQPGLMLMTNVVDCDLDAIRTGLPVTVTFEPAGDEAFVPVFRP